MAAAVLSGNRNFEGRINPLVKANYLASPPLVVAYALAGTTDIDLTTEPLGTGSDGKPVYLQRHLADARRRSTRRSTPMRAARDVPPAVRQRVRRRTRSGTRMPTSPKASCTTGTRRAPTSRSRRSCWTWPPSRARSSRSAAPGCLAVLGDSVTTDHISPAGSIAATSPAGKYLHRARRRSRSTSTATARAAATTG